MDSEKKEDNVAAMSKLSLPPVPVVPEKCRNRPNNFPVVAINSCLTPVLAVEENILEAAVIFAMSNAGNAANWGI